MYLSHLLINVGTNPDRPRPGRLWLRNVYHVHQRLSMAFPTRTQRAEDPLFLRPFDPAAFERPHFLFRIDNVIEDDCPRVVILVQSDIVPDWEYAFQNARMFLAAEPETREYNPTFSGGEKLRFRIRVNLSKKSSQYRIEADKTDTKGRPRTQGKRVALTWDRGQDPDEVIREWFAGKGEQRGFKTGACNVLHVGWVVGRTPKKNEGKPDGSRIKFRSAFLEGTLTVTDTPMFVQAVSSGIGSGKAFGFGLLSVAPV